MPNPLARYYPKKHAAKEEVKVETISRSIKHPDWLYVKMNNGELSEGPDQSWYVENYRRQRGCGPTTAALISAYIARKPDMVSLYKPYKGLSRSEGYIEDEYLLTKKEMLSHMNEMWRYIKPAPMGLWRSSMMSRGFVDYTSSRGVLMDTRRFLVSWLRPRSDKLWAELVQFIHHNLAFDIPIAWLIYDKGKMDTVQSWHWVSIIGISYESDFSQCTLQLIDHQRKLEVDLADWFRHSKLGGAFVAFRHVVSRS